MGVGEAGRDQLPMPIPDDAKTIKMTDDKIFDYPILFQDITPTKLLEQLVNDGTIPYVLFRDYQMVENPDVRVL